MMKKNRFSYFILILLLSLSLNRQAEASLVWVTEVLENSNEILNPADELKTCSSFHEHREDNISSSCQRVTGSHMSVAGRRSFCENVANNCFSHYYSSLGLYKSREKCLNVSSDCYFEISKATDANSAVDKCLDVSNICYRIKRKAGRSINDSVKACH